MGSESQVDGEDGMTQYPLFPRHADLEARDHTIRELRLALVDLLQVSECTCPRGPGSLPCPHQKAERILKRPRV